MEQKDIEKFQAEAQACAEPLGRIKIEMGRVIAGQDQLIDRLLLALVADGTSCSKACRGLPRRLPSRHSHRRCRELFPDCSSLRICCPPT